MYISITPQKLAANYSASAADFVAYLEKENQVLDEPDMEQFFNQYGDAIPAEEVVREIDANTDKLKKTEPKFYSITVSPSKYELGRLQNTSEDLKQYTREIMRDYVSCFNREINGRPVSVNDLKYYAKIEHQRTYKGTDIQVKENQPYATKILNLKNELHKIQTGELNVATKKIEKQIEKLEVSAPHQLNGKRIVQGMKKEGPQSHIHIIVSRKDASNSFSLSPGSKYKASEVIMNGKTVRRGFDRDAFYSKAEKTFDRNFGYKRNFVETYQSRKILTTDPKIYFSALLGLPASEKALAFKMLGEAGIPILSIPTNKVQLALSSIHKIKRGFELALRSSSIGI